MDIQEHLAAIRSAIQSAREDGFRVTYDDWTDPGELEIDIPGQQGSCLTIIDL